MTDANGGGGSSTAHPLTVAEEPNEDRSNTRAPNETLFDAEEFGGLTSCIQMSTAIRKACTGRGLVDVVNFDGVTTEQTYQDPESILIKEALLATSVSSTFHFFPCQAEAISRIVHMQLRTIKTEIDDETEVFPPPRSDIGMAALVDLPTGVGKTIMTLVASILIAIGRGLDMEKSVQVQRDAYMWSNGRGVLSQEKLDSYPIVGPGRKIIVFANTQLVAQWQRQGELAAQIVKSMPYANVKEWDVTVVKAGVKNTGAELLREKEICIYVCDTSDSKVKPKQFLRSNIYYSALIFDEAAAKKDNPLVSRLPAGIEFARLIMISADLSPWRTSFKPNQYSVFKNIFKTWENYSSRTQDTATTAALSATSVFSPDERSSVLEAFAEPMTGRLLYVASYKYKPSLTERIGAGLDADLGVEKARDVFRRLYDIDITDCSTVGDMLDTIKESACLLEAQKEDKRKARREEQSGSQWGALSDQWRKMGKELEKLETRLQTLEELASKVSKLLEEECGICFGSMKKVSLIQPCLHFVCTGCIKKIRGNSCPWCRTKMTVGVHLDPRLEAGPCKKQKLVPVVPVLAPVEAASSSEATATIGATMGEIFVNKIQVSGGGANEPVGVAQAVARTLETIKIARSESDDRHDTLCVMVICPGVEIRQGMFNDLGFGVTQYRTKGTKANPHYKKAFEMEMKHFQEKDGECKILIVQDASNLNDGSTADNMTGLDIDGLDAVVSVGRGNLAQRMGRLCRFSRAKASAKKHALYVEIVPR